MTVLVRPLRPEHSGLLRGTRGRGFDFREASTTNSSLKFFWYGAFSEGKYGDTKYSQIHVTTILSKALHWNIIAWNQNITHTGCKSQSNSKGVDPSLVFKRHNLNILAKTTDALQISWLFWESNTKVYCT